MKKKEKILIGILLILLVIVGSIYINVKNTNKGSVIQRQETSKGQLTETSGENAYVSTQSHLAEVNAQNQELTDLNTQISNTTVTADRLLKGYTAYKNGNIITGTMEDRGALNWAPTTSTTYTVPAGYYSGGTLNSAGAYNAGVAATKKGTAGQAQVLSGYTFTNASGVGLSGTMVNRGAVSQTLNLGGSYTIPAGYHNGSGRVTVSTSGKYYIGSFTIPAANSGISVNCGFKPIAVFYSNRHVTYKLSGYYNNGTQKQWYSNGSKLNDYTLNQISISSSGFSYGNGVSDNVAGSTMYFLAVQ